MIGIYDAKWVADSLSRLTADLHAAQVPGAACAIVGIRTRGAILAERLHAGLSAMSDTEYPLGFIDTTLYRDDLHLGAGLKTIKATEIDFDLNDRPVILVDDVLSTGRTIRAAMDALFTFGRPTRVWLCVMLDRGHRELPIQADFCGAEVEVPPGGVVRLRLSEIDGRDEVYILAAGEKDPE